MSNHLGSITDQAQTDVGQLASRQWAPWHVGTAPGGNNAVNLKMRVLVLSVLLLPACMARTAK